jgi:predicted RNA-binding protein YlxR (DUF448 family)
MRDAEHAMRRDVGSRTMLPGKDLLRIATVLQIESVLTDAA